MKRAHGLHLVLQNWLNNNFFRRVEKGIRFPDLLPVQTPQNTEHFAKKEVFFSVSIIIQQHKINFSFSHIFNSSRAEE